MDRRFAWVVGIVVGGGVLCFLSLMVVVALALKDNDDVGRGADRVGVVEISGTIKDSKKTLKQIRELKSDEHLKAVVVRIDSPGGAVGPSQEIYDAVRDLAKTKKVVASMGALAASGGFYIACGAEKVYANPGTLTGSIGVVMQLPNVEGLMKWAKVDMNVITSGKLKDSGSPFRTMTPDERAYFETVLTDVHQQFIEAVAAGRKLPPEEVKPIADGRVFTGRQAKAMKMVDELGGFNDAVAAAAKMAGIEGEPKIAYPKEDKKFLKELFSDGADGLMHSTLESLGGVGLQYRLPAFEVQ
jgi:protease IV